MTAPRTGDDAGLREAVADAIKPLVDDTDASYPQIAEGAIRAVRSWDEANAGSVPVAGWVACSERMPDKGQRVMITANLPGLSGEDAIEMAMWEGVCWMGAYFNHEKKSVTHWMPLPPLPPAPGEAAATVPMTVGRDLAEDVSDVLFRFVTAASGCSYSPSKIAAELTRLGWVHSSQATGGGLSGEAKEVIQEALSLYASIGDDGTITGPFDAIEAARAELAALPVRGDGT